MIDADYNDLGFTVENRLMVLIESQSTWTFNIIIRALMYLIQTYHDYFKRTNQNLYGSKKVNMPKPELYVIYTGERKAISDTISLSKEFFDEEKIAIEVEQYQFIDGHKQEFGVRWLLRRMGICPNVYYNYRKDRKAGYREWKEQLKHKILQIYHKYSGNPGYRMMRVYLLRAKSV